MADLVCIFEVSFEDPRTARECGGGMASGGFEDCCAKPGSNLGRKPLIEGMEGRLLWITTGVKSE